jgi:hypothetical protein
VLFEAREETPRSNPPRRPSAVSSSSSFDAIACTSVCVGGSTTLIFNKVTGLQFVGVVVIAIQAFREEVRRRGEGAA